jgi:single-stranded DNA-binding protein
MPVNVVMLSGMVERPALRYDDAGKPEFRCTLKQSEKGFALFFPCVAVGATAERLASELEEGAQIVTTSAKLVWRKRQVKVIEQSRLEILVWSVERLTESPQVERSEHVATEEPPTSSRRRLGCPRNRERRNVRMLGSGALARCQPSRIKEHSMTRISVEGVILDYPQEQHEHSKWFTIRTERGQVVRVIVATSAECSPWIAPGAAVKLTGAWVTKQWADGAYATLTCHESVEVTMIPKSAS